jgi:hypothetical protein
MQGRDTTNSTFNQLFEPIFSQKFHQLLQKLESPAASFKKTASLSYKDAPPPLTLARWCIYLPQVLPGYE